MPTERPYSACATPPGTSGIAVIRMAGDGSSEVLDRVFRIIRTVGDVRRVVDMPGYTAAYGILFDPKDNHTIDEVICTRFTAPHSYTGEDSIEISCHGGLAVRQEILRVLHENGARAAEPGEFTKNAFLHGKLDLTQAEAVMDVISAESRMALNAAETLLGGALKEKIREISAQLYQSFAALEMLVEFPEHEDTPENIDAIADELAAGQVQLEALAESFSQGRIVRDGMSVVLGGLPNSGKSSLFNHLAGYDRAIVTDVPGTTRDTLEVMVTIHGIPVRLEDTAGLRETGDEIESIGVKRALEALLRADLVLWLVSSDTDEMPEREVAELRTALSGAQGDTSFGVLISKSDTMTQEESFAARKHMEEQVTSWNLADRVTFYEIVSAATGSGIDALSERIRGIYEERGQGHAGGILVTNRRHYEQIDTARRVLEEAITVLRISRYPDMACSLLRVTAEALGEITGDTVSDALVGTIFARFCVGK